MQTTLRLNDELYREAKAKAAREGITLTRFLEEGISLRLNQESKGSGIPHAFRVHEPDQATALTEDEIQRIAAEEQEKEDHAKAGLTTSNS